MKVYVKYIIITLLATLAVLSCKKNEPVLTGEPILMSFKEAGQTKALLDAETFAAIGNKIQVYDYYTDANETESIYINDIATSSGNGTWPFTESHKWTTDGVHKFFGWMTNDASSGLAATDLFTSEDFTFDEGSKTLTLPTTTLTQESPQFDFMYSNIHERDLNYNPYFTAVPLEFSHLFTAFRVTAANNSSNIIKLKSVTIAGLRDTRKATLYYSSDDRPTIAYDDAEMASIGSFTFQVNGGYADKNLPATNSETGPLVLSDYYLMWPHSKDDFKESGEMPAGTITVVYDYVETDENGNVVLTLENESKVVKLQDIASWDAGKKYDLNLQFKDKEIILHCLVQDWIPVEEDVDFSEQVYASKPLTWKEGTVEFDDPKSGRVFLFSDEDKVAECEFQIDSPKGATWTASLISIEGHPDAFSIVEDTKYGPVGIERSIKIKINNIDPISQRHVCKLRITIQTADGRTIVANNLMPDETDEEITEYTIIQNLING